MRTLPLAGALGLLLVVGSLLACSSCVAQSLTSILETATQKDDKASRERSYTPVGFGKLLAFEYPLDQRQSLTLTTELERFSSFDGRLIDGVERQPTWKFKAIPITAGYVYKLGNPSWRIVPEVGAGLSYYLCKTTLRDYSALSDAGRPDATRGYGMGYGAQATLGLRASLRPNLFTLVQARYRYVNGFGLTGGSHTFGNEFAKFDFAIGFGVTL